MSIAKLLNRMPRGEARSHQWRSTELRCVPAKRQRPERLNNLTPFGLSNEPQNRRSSRFSPPLRRLPFLRHNFVILME
jgi:hypothetical protein